MYTTILYVYYISRLCEHVLSGIYIQ